MHPEFDLDRWMDLAPDDIAALESAMESLHVQDVIGRTRGNGGNEA